MATISAEEYKALKEEIKKLKAENAEMKKFSKLKIQICDRDRVAVVFGTYECRLFKSQWLKIFEHSDDVAKFIIDHDEELY
jgi:hypothetical protein